ncbi:hypothetical protein [Tenacibaculum soleae]|uniref:hypothetical protein n=1 Tax=Tenacibaculum soleae TaxID=447689 RepID=UPI0023005028|nr:hypothetical protein [Tenacibaculum soleae]
MKLKKWQKVGLSWGMFIIMTFVWPLIDGEEITLKRTLFSLVIWTIAGFAFGWSMRHNHKEK